MSDFCTIQDVRDFLQMPITAVAQVAAVGLAITWATEAIKNYCHQVIERVEDEAITLDCDGGVRLFLPELPVVSVAEVVEDGETLVEGDDYKLAAHGVLHRVDQNWASGVQIVEITYTHGYSTIPADVVAVCARAASRAFQAGLRAAEAEGIAGIQGKALGDYSVTFASEHGGGVGEGLMGASGARMLLLSEKDLLNRYRYKRY
jgi:hypothetical protein